MDDNAIKITSATARIIYDRRKRLDDTIREIANRLVVSTLESIRDRGHVFSVHGGVFSHRLGAEDFIEVTYQYWSGDTDRYYETRFPISWLDLSGDDLAVQIAERAERINAIYKEEKAAKQAEVKRATEEAERRQYERLKTKFG